jgi:hypothetical protein
VEIRDQTLPSPYTLFAADGIRKTETTFRKSAEDNENIMKQVSSIKGLCETFLFWGMTEIRKSGFRNRGPAKHFTQCQCLKKSKLYVFVYKRLL